jgi:hypothetical protein
MSRFPLRAVCAATHRPTQRHRPVDRAVLVRPRVRCWIASAWAITTANFTEFNYLLAGRIAAIGTVPLGERTETFFTRVGVDRHTPPGMPWSGCGPPATRRRQRSSGIATTTCWARCSP